MRSDSVNSNAAICKRTGNGGNGSANAQLVDDACRIDIKRMLLHTMENMPILIDLVGSESIAMNLYLIRHRLVLTQTHKATDAILYKPTH